MKNPKKILLPATSVGAFIIAIIIGGIVIMFNGDNPLIAYGALFEGAFSSLYNIVNTLSSATPLIFTGLGVAVAFKAGIANIGAEGQLYMGAIASAVIAIYLKLPAPLLIAATFIGGVYCWRLICFDTGPAEG